VIDVPHKRLQKHLTGLEPPWSILLPWMSERYFSFISKGSNLLGRLSRDWIPFIATHSNFPFSFFQLNSKNLTDFGPMDDHAGSGDETTYNAVRLPGAKRGDDGSRSSKVEVLTSQVSFSSTGREWAAVSGEGLHVYSLDEDMIFDPISLTENITPAAVESKLMNGDYAIALQMAVHLNEFALVRQVLEETPFASITHVVRTIGPEHLERLMQFIAKIMDTSPHVEFYLEWCLEMLKAHGMHMDKHRTSFMRATRAMHKVVQTRDDELKTICNQNRYNLDFIASQARLVQSQQEHEAQHEVVESMVMS
jgi:periodic tryptophan protein 2